MGGRGDVGFGGSGLCGPPLAAVHEEPSGSIWTARRWYSWLKMGTKLRFYVWLASEIA